MSNDPSWRLVIHGGAGTFARDRRDTDDAERIRAGLAAALDAGATLLAAGGEALDAVERSVRALEDDPDFNAGRGSVLTYEGTIELDASIMDGRNRNAGAVTGVSHTRNPISLARAVMEHSPHVLLSGEGADTFSRLRGLDQATADYFETAERRRQLDELKSRPASEQFDLDIKYGTVGAVAVDQAGHVAAATSTGGLTGKRWGRIGDSPIIGAGTYADDRACAVSATGAGEFFLRVSLAHDIAARIRCAKTDPTCGTLPPDAVRGHVEAAMAEMAALGGSGGVIVVTPWGDGLYCYNTPGMYRGQAGPDGRSVAIFDDERPVPSP
jgi:beta-aspartyl-peptidase (threonine type)